MPVLLVLVLAAIVEIVVLVAVSHAIGLLATVLLLVAASLFGGWLVRHEGRRAVAAFTDALRARRVPRDELTDGGLIAAGGVLILLPGFVSDAAGLLFLVPSTRAMLRRRLLRRVERHRLLARRFGGGIVVEGSVVSPEHTAARRPELP